MPCNDVVILNEIYIIVVDNVFIKQFLEFGVTNRKYKH
jgi:hypothetical protein